MKERKIYSASIKCYMLNILEKFMSLKGYLFTKKQYKKSLCLIIGSLVIAGMITLSGFMIAILADNAVVVIAGIIVGIVGFVLLMISVVNVFKNSAKLQLFRQFKKHPEDFENEAEQLD